MGYSGMTAVPIMLVCRVHRASATSWMNCLYVKAVHGNENSDGDGIHSLSVWYTVFSTIFSRFAVRMPLLYLKYFFSVQASVRLSVCLSIRPPVCLIRTCIVDAETRAHELCDMRLHWHVAVQVDTEVMDRGGWCHLNRTDRKVIRR